MAIQIAHYDAATAYTSHEGTILAQRVTPEGLETPFWHQYGHLTRSRAMAGHVHETDEIYIVMEGSGYVMLGGEVRPVRAGDVVAVPHGVWHTMICTERDEEPFLWAALWWDALPVAQPQGVDAAAVRQVGHDALIVPSPGIDVLRFDRETAHLAHIDTILASEVVPASIKAPFDHAYGYLHDGGEMELHKHPKHEFYIVFEGTGTVTVGNETAAVRPGDVINIPPDEMHTMTGKKGEPFLWAAFWW